MFVVWEEVCTFALFWRELNNLRYEQISYQSLHNRVSVFSYELLDLTHHPIEFIDQIRVINVPAKGCDERSVIPKRPVHASAESLEHLQTVSSELGQNRTCVMQLV